MRFHSKPIQEHPEVPLADDGQWDALVQQWSARARSGDAALGSESARSKACYVLCVVRAPQRGTLQSDPDAQLEEIEGLVIAQGDCVVGREQYPLQRPDARTLIRSGVAERIGSQARACGADMLVVDAELTPSQTRNLEDVTGLPVCDREAVILNVFQRHATTPRSRIQVELAHLQYLRPRIRGIGLDMDQQAGGFIGARGAGETASELLARRIDGRIAELRQRLSRLRQGDAARRKHRAQATRVALVGYTNAGKTTLMNGLTAAGLSARDRPFETLDTTARCLSRHGGDVLLSDTVGFIRYLPERLFESFASTLAELAEASLLLIAVDVSDPECRAHLQTTEAVLRRLGAHEVPRLVVLNKVDRLPAPPAQDVCQSLSGGHPHHLLSALDADAVQALHARILAMARAGHCRRELFVPDTMIGIAQVTADIYRGCRVLRSRACPSGTQYLIEGPPHVVAALAHRTRRQA